jgi:uncharacterized protein YcbK (DUF882 family)
MGRDVTHANELIPQIRTNAEQLLEKVNGLLIQLEVAIPRVTSGWRPPSINRKAGGATRSLHIEGKAIDLEDFRGHLAYYIIQSHHLLEAYGLWLEFPSATPGWVHLDMGRRSPRSVRTFLP